MKLRLCRIIIDEQYDHYCDQYSDKKVESLIIATSIQEIVEKVISKTEQFSWTSEFTCNLVLNKKSIKDVLFENKLYDTIRNSGHFSCLVPVFDQHELDEWFDESQHRLRDKLLIDVSILDSTKLNLG